MVKTLVLVRHGEPEAPGAQGSDFERELTPQGAHALRVAYPRTFALLGADAQATVWSSPALRALQTAEVAADAVDAAGIEVKDYLYAQDQAAFMDELAASDAETLVVVGHAPFMDQMLARLTGVHLAFGKGAAAAVQLPADGPAAAQAAGLLWYVGGPEVGSWEAMAQVERAVAEAAAKLDQDAAAFFAAPEDAELLRLFRVALRRVRSLLQFLAPWQSKKQNRRLEHVLKELQVASARLRELDVLSACAAGLVEDGELGENSLLPMACAKERQLECASFMELVRSRRAGRALEDLADELAHLSWRGQALSQGLTTDDFCNHFDAELERLDADLFGLDLRDGNAVYAARRDAKEMHYVAGQLACVLGAERALMSEAMDSVQTELGALSAARQNQRLAEECSKSPRFRGVRADLGVVARDQSEVVSAMTQGMERMEAAEHAAPPAADGKGKIAKSKKSKHKAKHKKE